MNFSVYLAITLYLGILIWIGKRNYSKEASVDEYLIDNQPETLDLLLQPLVQEQVI